MSDEAKATSGKTAMSELKVRNGKLMITISEQEIQLDDKDARINKLTAENIKCTGEVDRLTKKAREYFRKFNSEQLAKRKAEDKLKETQDDILILVRQLSVTIRYRERRGNK